LLGAVLAVLAGGKLAPAQVVENDWPFSSAAFQPANGQVNGQINGQVNGQLNGQIDGQGPGSILPTFGENFFGPNVDPRWTFSFDAMILDRSPGHETIVRRQVGGMEVLNAEDFDFSFEAGPRIGIRRNGDLVGLELLHFNVTGWLAHGTATAPPNIQTATPPGSGIILFAGSMEFANISKLYSTEANVRLNLTENITGLAGFRWIEFYDRLSLDTSGTTSRIWTEHNHLYGGQMGLDIMLWRGELLDICIVKKAGIYGNAAEGRGELPGAPVLDQEVTGGHLAFVGELGLNTGLRLTRNWVLVSGYNMIWIDGLALAPDQVPRLDLPIPANSTFDVSGSIFAHGGTIGLAAEY
jgi:hypothetical protein